MDFDSERLSRLLPHRLWDLWSSWLSCFVNSFVYDKRAATARTTGLFARAFGAFASPMRCADVAIEEHRELRGQKCVRKFCWYKIRYVIRPRNRVCPLPKRSSRCVTYRQILTNCELDRAMAPNVFVSHQWRTRKCIERSLRWIKESYSPRHFIAFVAFIAAWNFY